MGEVDTNFSIPFTETEMLFTSKSNQPLQDTLIKNEKINFQVSYHQSNNFKIKFILFN